jgi:hypothetical protein
VPLQLRATPQQLVPQPQLVPQQALLKGPHLYRYRLAMLSSRYHQQQLTRLLLAVSLRIYCPLVR